MAVPIFKTSMRYKPGNYWPVSLTSVVFKILEKIRKLFRYLGQNRILSEKQHCFNKSCSCFINLLVTSESWCVHKDQTLPIDLAFIGFSKAFDKILYNRLLCKVSNIEIGGNLIMWTKDFLVAHQKEYGRTPSCLSWKRWWAECFRVQFWGQCCSSCM